MRGFGTRAVGTRQCSALPVWGSTHTVRLFLAVRLKACPYRNGNVDRCNVTSNWHGTTYTPIRHGTTITPALKQENIHTRNFSLDVKAYRSPSYATLREVGGLRSCSQPYLENMRCCFDDSKACKPIQKGSGVKENRASMSWMFISMASTLFDTDVGQGRHLDRWSRRI